MESHQLTLRLISLPSASIFLTRPMAVADPLPSDVALESENGERAVELFAGIFADTPEGAAARRNNQQELPLCTVIQ